MKPTFNDFIGLDAKEQLWVCVVLDALFNRLPRGHPRLLFKGGTSLSKGFNLIRRFSEDIVVFRQDLGLAGDEDPTNRKIRLSNNERQRRFDGLKAACRAYVGGRLAADLTALLNNTGCSVTIDESDRDGQTLLVAYPAASIAGLSQGYVQPRVKIECGARSALEPIVTTTSEALIQTELSEGWDLNVDNLHCIRPDRTYWEKLLILHGIHCGYRDAMRLPADPDRLSRHYYDVAMISSTELGREAHKNIALWDDVREHHLIAFRQSWKRFEEAKPGTIKIVPQEEVRSELKRDYQAMQGMIMGPAPAFDSIVERLSVIEAELNTV